MTDLYETLGIDRDAIPKDIHRAYRKKAKSAHPDVGGDREVWDAICLAYDTLSDPDRRAHYDATGEITKTDASNTIGAMLSQLSMLFDQALNAIANQAPGTNPASVDMIHVMLQVLSIADTACQKDLSGLSQQRAVLVSMLDRFEPEDENSPDHMRAVIEEKIRILDKRLLTPRNATESHRAIHLYLEGCRFKRKTPSFLENRT